MHPIHQLIQVFSYVDARLAEKQTVVIQSNPADNQPNIESDTAIRNLNIRCDTELFDRFHALRKQLKQRSNDQALSILLRIANQHLNGKKHRPPNVEIPPAKPSPFNWKKVDGDWLLVKDGEN